MLSLKPSKPTTSTKSPSHGDITPHPPQRGNKPHHDRADHRRIHRMGQPPRQPPLAHDPRRIHHNSNQRLRMDHNRRKTTIRRHLFELFRTDLSRKNSDNQITRCIWAMARIEKDRQNQTLQLNDDFVTYTKAGDEEWGRAFKTLAGKSPLKAWQHETGCFLN